MATHLRVRTDDERAGRLTTSARARSAMVSSITRGENLACGCQIPAAGRSIPALAREVSDVTGAGDTVVATLSLALAAGATTAEAAAIANQAAGIVVGKFGPATLTAAEARRLFLNSEF